MRRLCKKTAEHWVPWGTPITPAAGEAEAGELPIQGQPQQLATFCDTVSK